jgi:hypothetical protein
MREFPTITAKDLRNHRERPRQVKMLTREFIDGKVHFKYHTWKEGGKKGDCLAAQAK